MITSKPIKVGTRAINAMFTKEMIRSIYKLSGMINELRKASIKKILNSK